MLASAYMRFGVVVALLLDKSHTTTYNTDEIEHLNCTFWDKTVAEEELWVQLGRQQPTLASGRAATVAAGGSGAAAVSQQDLELSTLLVLKLAVCLSVAYSWTEM